MGRDRSKQLARQPQTYYGLESFALDGLNVFLLDKHLTRFV
jgi:hypothetical protein